MDEEESFIEKGGIAGYLKRNYKDKTIGKEITPHVQSGLKILGDSYNDAMYQARRGLYGPHALVGSHAIDTIGKIIPDIPIDKGISHIAHNVLGIDKPLSDVTGQLGEIALTRKALKSIPKNLVSTKVTPYTKGLNPVNKKKLINITEEAFSSENSLFKGMNPKQNLIPSETSISVVKPGSLFSKDYKGILSKPQPYALESRPRINPSDARAIKRFNSIFNNKLQYPSLEEMNFALKSKSKRKKGEFYSRPDKTTEKQWAVIGKRLQETYGGTDVELNDFIERQKLAKAKIESEIDIENRLYQMNYLSMALEMIDNDMLEGVENMEDLYGNPVAIQDVADFAYVQAVRMSQDPSKAQTMELGHIKAGRNIFDESKHLTTADYESNMRSEMKRSIRNWKHPKSKPLEIIKGKDAKGRTTYEFTGGHLVEAGNRARGSDQDLPDIMNLLMGTMPNVETEYMRFLGELGYAVAPKQAIPTPEHFVAYMRNRWRKYQGWGKSKLLGKQQLERFPKVLRMYINDYLNDLDSGKFLNTKGRADATDDMILDDRVGKGKERTPWEEKVIVDKLNDILGPDTHRP